VTRLRSLLFAPAARADLVGKLPRAGADAVCLDCEDGTAPSRKAEAREVARTLGAELAAAGEQVWVRVNGADTGWFADDVAEAIPVGAAGVVLPVVERLEQLDRAGEALAAAGHRGLPVLAGLETARGVVDARTLLEYPAVAAAYFGAEDLIADLGGVRTPGNAEVAHARAAVALAARVAGVPVLDQVTTDFRDADRFTREAHEARAMGYTGKMCIHPAQVALASAAFTPTGDEVAAARRVVEAAEAGAAAGEGVVVVDGRMVDGPLIAQARRVLAQSAG
jgi:citrate lyase subunit beta / citryl-CoA lyase